MKKHYKLLIILIASSITMNAQTLWDDFENPSEITYFFVNGILTDTVNYASDAVNSSDSCAHYVRDGGQLYAVVGTEIDAVMTDVSSYVSGANKITMQVNSPNVGDTILITLEDKNTALPGNFPTGRHSEYRAITTVANQWEKLEFSFLSSPDANQSDTSLNRLIISFVPGTSSNSTYLFDSLVGPSYVDPCATVTPIAGLIEDFECQSNTTYDFSNGTLLNVLNPLVSGINTSKNCGKFIKFDPPLNDGAFGGTLDELFTVADYNKVHISLYDPAAPSEYIMILRDASDNDLFVETITTSSTTEWVEFDFDISAIPVNKTVENWIMLLNAPTDTQDTIFLDNFRMSSNVDSNDVSIKEVKNYNVSVYPNPATDMISISVANEMINKVIIYSIDGVLLSTTSSNSENVNCDISNLNNGVYLISAELNNGQIINQKFVK